MISVVIPTLNAASRLGPCLGALGPAVLDGMLTEVIFTDGGSTDDTAEIADLTGAEFIAGPSGRGGQLARGAAMARETEMGSRSATPRTKRRRDGKNDGKSFATCAKR